MFFILLMFVFFLTIRAQGAELPGHRALSFLDKNFGGVVPDMDLSVEDKQLLVRVGRLVRDYVQTLEKVLLDRFLC